MKQLKQLAEPEALKKKLITFAILDLIFCDEDWLRFYRFDSKWAPDVSMATIDNGAGDELFIVFSPEGVIMKGFDHESWLSPYAREEHTVFPGIYDEVPLSLFKLLDDEAFEKEAVTFCIWRESRDIAWRKGDVKIPEGEEDGAEFLLGMIFKTPEEYVEWAGYYYDRPISIEVITQIYEDLKIDEATIRSLNPNRDAQAVMQEWAILASL